MRVTTLEDKLTELLATRLTKAEKRRVEAVVKLTGISATQLIREALNNLVNQYLKVASQQPGR